MEVLMTVLMVVGWICGEDVAGGLSHTRDMGIGLSSVIKAHLSSLSGLKINTSSVHEPSAASTSR